MARPLPDQIDFGVAMLEVRYVNKAEMADAVDHDPDQDLSDVPVGAWDDDLGTIYIGKWLSRKQQKITLFHEIVHAALDLREQME